MAGGLCPLDLLPPARFWKMQFWRLFLSENVFFYNLHYISLLITFPSYECKIYFISLSPLWILADWCHCLAKVHVEISVLFNVSLAEFIFFFSLFALYFFSQCCLRAYLRRVGFIWLRCRAFARIYILPHNFLLNSLFVLTF